MVVKVKMSSITIFYKSSRGGLEVERLLHKLHDSILVDQSPLGACMIIWYQWTRYAMYVLDVCYIVP